MAEPTELQLPSDANASGRDLGDAEIANLVQVIRSGTLNSTKGSFVRRLERAFAERMGADHAVCCASGTAAIHAAIATLDLERGDEVITTAITDIGAIMPILYEGCVPVFADVDPRTALVTAETISARLTARTRAVIVTHLFGAPVDMRPILDLADRHGLTVIEDCAQAPLAEDLIGGVGTLGHVGCYSFQQGKHMTTGEGGAVITNCPDSASRLRKFVDKGWGYGEAQPDHDFPALNGRMTELSGAVGLAQLEKLGSVVDRRRTSAIWMRERLHGLPGIALPPIRPATRHSYWRFCLHVDRAVVPGGPEGLASALAAFSVPSQPRYIQRPAYRTRVFREWAAHRVTAGPYQLAGRTPEPEPGTMKGTDRVLDSILVMPWNELYTAEHLRFLLGAIRSSVSRLSSSSTGTGTPSAATS